MGSPTWRVNRVRPPAKRPARFASRPPKWGRLSVWRASYSLQQRRATGVWSRCESLDSLNRFPPQGRLRWLGLRQRTRKRQQVRTSVFPQGPARRSGPHPFPEPTPLVPSQNPQHSCRQTSLPLRQTSARPKGARNLPRGERSGSQENAAPHPRFNVYLLCRCMRNVGGVSAGAIQLDRYEKRAPIDRTDLRGSH